MERDLEGERAKLKEEENELAGRQQALSSAMERCVSQEALLGVSGGLDWAIDSIEIRKKNSKI